MTPYGITTKRHLSLGRASLAVVTFLLAACSDHTITPPDEVRSPNNAPVAGRALADYTISPLDVPGAIATSAQGINSAGTVSGWYLDETQHFHGFILAAGVFSTIDYPAADNTQLAGIGPDGTVVGNYWNDDEEGTADHGFRRTPDGTFALVHYPGHLYEIPQRILPDGTVLGCRHDHDFAASMKGVVLDRRGTTEIDAFASMNNGATPDGRTIVGLYLDQTDDVGKAYIIENGVFRSLMVPGSSFTSAWDINPRGEIVGVFGDGGGVHGWVGTETWHTTLDAPGAVATLAFGINARGDVVGAYVAGGAQHGYLARRM